MSVRVSQMPGGEYKGGVWEVVGDKKPRGGAGGASGEGADRRVRLWLGGQQAIKRAGRVKVRVAWE